MYIYNYFVFYGAFKYLLLEVQLPHMNQLTVCWLVGRLARLLVGWLILLAVLQKVSLQKVSLQKVLETKGIATKGIGNKRYR